MEKRARTRAGEEISKYRVLLGDFPNHEVIIKEEVASWTGSLRPSRRNTSITW